MQTAVADPPEDAGECLHPQAHEALLCDPAADEDIIIVKYVMCTHKLGLQTMGPTHRSIATNEAELRINCPDFAGLGCDITRMILDFGLSILSSQMNTDGRWCFLVMHVALAPPATGEVNWKLFKQRLEALCMPANAWAILQRRNSSAFEAPSQRAAFLLQISSTGHTGFLHGRRLSALR